MQTLSGWGNVPKHTGHVHSVSASHPLPEAITHAIPRGAGKSYGDSALANHMLSTSALDYFIDFDAVSGVLTCEAGVTLDQILQVFVPKGWFLPVTPGTKLISIGGAIASDVHGKNHHKHGCFSEFVISIDVATVSDGVVTCSTTQHRDLFFATCGGMGLTGLILRASIQLSPIKSAFIEQTTLRAQNLSECLTRFDLHQHTTYSVAWIDCLATRHSLGRSIISLGEHADQGRLLSHKPASLHVPCYAPNHLLNRYSVQAFNSAYYHKSPRSPHTELIHYDPFFYPLDGIRHWNRLYGKRGFLQYQFVIPYDAGYDALKEILTTLAHSQLGSFLAVLKVFGEQNRNLLSFPTKGYTLALDFNDSTASRALLERLDALVMAYQGRVYLTKDARMSAAMFAATYPNVDAFRAIRKHYQADAYFHSLQSSRLGL